MERYYRSVEREDFFKYDDGFEEYFMQMQDGKFAIIELVANISFKEITKEEFDKLFIATALVDVIKRILP